MKTRIAALLAKHAAIDAFGVGTALATPGDAPHLNLIYKLVEVERGGIVREAAKLSAAKVTYPGRKQVFRYSAPSGEYRHDRIALDGEPADGGEPMLVEVMRARPPRCARRNRSPTCARVASPASRGSRERIARSIVSRCIPCITPSASKRCSKSFAAASVAPR